MPGLLQHLKEAAQATPGRLSKKGIRAPTDTLGERLAQLRSSDLGLDRDGVDIFGTNNRVYDKILERMGVLEDRWSDVDFERLHGYADGEGLEPDLLEELLAKYGRPAPPALLRGDTGLDLPDGGRTTRALSSTVSPNVAEEFAEVGAGRIDPSQIEYDRVLNRLNSYSVKDDAQRALVLPVPMSGQSEFIIAPHSRVDLMEHLDADQAEDGMIRRLYRLRKKFGGVVKGAD